MATMNDLVAAEADCKRLEAENERLRGALKPFGIIADNYAKSHEISAQHHRDEKGADYKFPPPPDSHYVPVALGHCRAASAALGDQQETPAEKSK